MLPGWIDRRLKAFRVFEMDDEVTVIVEKEKVLSALI
jgi:hypothetical protein